MNYLERAPMPTMEPEPEKKTNPVDAWLKKTFGRTEKELKEEGQKDAGLHREAMEQEHVDTVEEENK